MKKYNIVNLILEAEEVPDCFRNFEISDNGEEQDPKKTARIRVKYIDQEEMEKPFREITQVSGLKVGMSENEWVYQDIMSGCRMYIDRDYSIALISEKVKELNFLWGFFIQLLIQCRLLDEDVLTVHSCCVKYRDTAYVFSGPSGCGKSTRAGHWVEELQAEYISGDRPAIDVRNMYAFGAPWDGKEKVYKNIHAPLSAVFQVRRAGFTRLRRLTPKQGRDFLISQLFIPMWDDCRAMKALVLLSGFVEKAPIYRLFCSQYVAGATETCSIITEQQEKILEESKDMKLDEGFILKSMAGENVIMPVGDNISKFNGTVLLNEVSAFIVKQLQAGNISRDDMLELLLNEYDVDRETASEDLDELIEKLCGMGVISLA